MAGESSVAETVGALLQAGGPGSLEAINKHVTEIMASPGGSMDRIYAVAERVVCDNVNIQLAREVMAHFCTVLKAATPALIKTVSTRVLELMQPRSHSFQAQANQIREILADVYVNEDQYMSAARVLEQIDPHGQNSTMSSEKKMEVNVKIAQLYLEVEDHIKAETFINRATRLAAQNTNKNLDLLYKACHVRVADKKRKYILASQRYYQLSLEPVVEFGERMSSLSFALNCAVLAPAGAPRSRILATLYKDERSKNLRFYDILERMHLGQILRHRQIQEFEEQLQDHHKALLPDGATTVLDRAMMEHNIFAASKIYRNISFNELGALLGVSADRAERMTADMISEERMQGRIDQLTGFLYFPGYDVLQSWNERIRVICTQANAVSERVVEAQEV